ncbi:MAG: SBBP repeat-containing protein [Bacteroidota bacterium]|nr:SBBP repeat-containing protein [Bacteroidota bacterium]
MDIKKHFALFIIAQLIWSSSLLAKVDEPSLLANSKAMGFTQNKGQIIDQNNNPNPEVLYLLNGNGLNVQIRKTGFSYDIFSTQRKTKAVLGLVEPIQKLPSKYIEPDEVTYNFHRIDIILLGSNPKAKVIAEGKSDDYTNYYNLEHAPDGILNVHQYQKVIFKDIYPGIDIEYLLNEKGFKYNFVVHAGANLSDIKLQYKGAPFKANRQELIFNTSQGEFKEIIPASWLIKNGLNQTVQVDYNLLDKETIGFKTKAQITSFDLVVDPNPNRLWGTYYGGSNNEECRSTCTDPSSNVYIGGITESAGNIATTGSHQSIYGINADAFLVKFNTNGVRQWATYYGGSSADEGNAICTDASSNVYMFGYTPSTNNIATSGSHQSSNGGSIDAFLVKFNTNGFRQWGTYYGGSSGDFGSSICSDASSNVYVAGWSSSANNIATSGSHQSTYGINTDAFLVKFNTNGLRQWGTYYGGSNGEIGNAICTDASSNVYLSGYTQSTNNIASSGSHQTIIGGQDAFLVKFNTNGARQWGTYYGGGSFEVSFSICTDATSNVYMTGYTLSSNNISTSGSNQPGNGGGYDGFLVKFNTNGVRQWGTYYGGTGEDWGRSVCTDAAGSIYLSGYTRSPNNIATSGSHQPSSGGPQDAFLVKFNTNGVRQWGTYYGESQADGLSICTDASSNVYLSGLTLISSPSPNNIATSGSHQPSNGGSFDAFLVKFEGCATSGPLGTIGTINNPASTYCANTNYTFTLSATTANSNGYWWTVPAGWVIVSGQTTTTLTVRPSGSGTLSVKAYNNCGDSTLAASRSVTATAPLQPSAISTSQGQLINGIRTLCNGTSATFTVTNVSGNTYAWTFPSGWSGAGTTNSTTRTVGFLSDTIRVKAVNTTTGCSSEERKLFVQVFQIPAMPGAIQGPSQACRSLTNNYSVDSVSFATSYNWTVPTGWSIISGAGTRSILVSAGTSSGNMTVTASNLCNTSSQRSLAVTSAPAPAQASNINGPTSLCAGAANLTYSVTAVSGVQYRWVLPTNWQILSGANTNQITVSLPLDATSGTIQVFPANISNSLCEGLVRTLSVMVISFGTPSSISGSSNLCVGRSSSFSISSISGATSYVWTLPSGWTGSSSSTLINATVGSATGDFNISIRGVNGTCSSAVAQLPVTVYNEVSQPAAILGNTAFCGNTQQNFSISEVANATSYLWTLPSGWNFIGTNNTNAISTNIGNIAGNVNLSVQAINLGCSSVVRTLSVNVNLTPQIGSISGLTNTCAGANQNYSVSATNAVSYTWTLPSGWTGSSSTNIINITFNEVADTLRVIANGGGGCNSVQQKRFINVQTSPPQPIISGLTQVCSSQFEIYRVSKLSSISSYTWTVPSGWDMSPSNGISADTIMLIRPTNGLAGSITVKATSSNGCVGADRIMNIPVISTVIPSAPAAIMGDNAFCKDVNKTYSIQAVGGATGYNWTIPSGWSIVSGQNTTNLTVLPSSNTGTIQVQTVQGGCRSSYTSLSALSIYTKPNKPQSITPSSQPACESSIISLASNFVSGANSYVWQLPGDWSFMGDQTQRVVQVQVGSANGNVTVRGKNQGCESDSSLSLGITVNKLPQFLGGIAGEKYVKTNTIRNYSIAATDAINYNWSMPAGWLLLSGANTSSISVLTGSQNATLTVNVSNNCGAKQSSINIITGVSTSIDENIAFKNLKVYPVPSSGFLYIDYEMHMKQLVNYQLYNLSGQILLSGMLVNQKAIEAIELTNLPAGIYFIKFNSETKTNHIHKIQIIK